MTTRRWLEAESGAKNILGASAYGINQAGRISLPLLLQPAFAASRAAPLCGVNIIANPYYNDDNTEAPSALYFLSFLSLRRRT